MLTFNAEGPLSRQVPPPSRKAGQVEVGRVPIVVKVYAVRVAGVGGVRVERVGRRAVPVGGDARAGGDRRVDAVRPLALVRLLKAIVIHS